jgi:hypothetical protein
MYHIPLSSYDNEYDMWIFVDDIKINNKETIINGDRYRNDKKKFSIKSQ